jgi:hypothetical protein
MEHEKSNFDEVLKSYLENNIHREISDDGKTPRDIDLKNEENDDFTNASNLTNYDSFSIIVNEKNQLIEEMKLYISNFRVKYEDEINLKNIQVNNLKN